LPATRRSGRAAASFWIQILQRNTATGNGMNGIAIDVGSIKNTIVGNTSTGQTTPFFDLLDANPSCRRLANSWRDNTFGTSSPDCLQ
jgi:hypothetical protein